MTQRTKEESESQSHVGGGGELGKGDRCGKPPVLWSPLGARVSALIVRKVGCSEIMECTKASSTLAFSEAGYVSGGEAWLVACFTLCKRHRHPFSLASWLAHIKLCCQRVRIWITVYSFLQMWWFSRTENPVLGRTIFSIFSSHRETTCYYLSMNS